MLAGLFLYMCIQVDMPLNVKVAGGFTYLFDLFSMRYYSVSMLSLGFKRTLIFILKKTDLHILKQDIYLSVVVVIFQTKHVAYVTSEIPRQLKVPTFSAIDVIIIVHIHL